MDADKVADNTKRSGLVWSTVVNHNKMKMAVPWFRKNNRGMETRIAVVMVLWWWWWWWWYGRYRR